jgi:hypothetical protein
MYQKYTGLWTGNNFIMPEREFLTKPDGIREKIIELPPSEERDDLRSETPRLFAEAVKKSNK